MASSQQSKAPLGEFGGTYWKGNLWVQRLETRFQMISRDINIMKDQVPPSNNRRVKEETEYKLPPLIKWVIVMKGSMELRVCNHCVGT